MPLPTYADGSLDAGKAASVIEELEGALRGVLAAWDSEEGNFWDRMQPAIDQTRAVLDDGPDEGSDAYEDSSPGKARVGGSNEDDYFCVYCRVRSEKPHDHTDDTVEPLERPRGDY